MIKLVFSALAALGLAALLAPAPHAGELSPAYAALSDAVKPVEVRTEPPAVRAACSDRFDYVLPTFRRRKDGSYALELLMHFRRGEARYSQDRWKAVDFSIADGTIERDGRQLLWTDGSVKIPVAKTKWWYEPKWYLTGNAKLTQKTTRLDSERCEISGVALVLRRP